MIVFHMSEFGKIEMSTDGSDVCNHKDDDSYWKRVDLLSIEMLSTALAKTNKLQLEVMNNENT